MTTLTLGAGTVLYHGTNSDDFQEDCDNLHGPAWLSSSKEVARHFATRSGGWGGQPRIIAYRLAEDVTLPCITSGRQMDAFADDHDLDLTGVDAMRESVERAGLPGWIIPHNYRDGDDILLTHTDVLEYVETEPCIATSK